jgi:hypothetical protein
MENTRVFSVFKVTQTMPLLWPSVGGLVRALWRPLLTRQPPHHTRPLRAPHSPTQAPRRLAPAPGAARAANNNHFVLVCQSAFVTPRGAPADRGRVPRAQQWGRSSTTRCPWPLRRLCQSAPCADQHHRTFDPAVEPDTAMLRSRRALRAAVRRLLRPPPGQPRYTAPRQGRTEGATGAGSILTAAAQAILGAPAQPWHGLNLDKEQEEGQRGGGGQREAGEKQGNEAEEGDASIEDLDSAATVTLLTHGRGWQWRC